MSARADLRARFAEYFASDPIIRQFYDLDQLLDDFVEIAADFMETYMRAIVQKQQEKQG